MQNLCLTTTCCDTTFHSWSRTYIFQMAIGSLGIGCYNVKYHEPLKNLRNLGCIKALPQTLQAILTAIHQINTRGLFN